MPIPLIATYRPAWASNGARVRGADEDGTTMAVAAASLLVEEPNPVRPDGITFVTRVPDLIEGPTEAVLRGALRLDPGVPVEVRLGGAAATLDVLASAPAGTLILTADPDAPAAAAAAFVGEDGATVKIVGRHDTALPARVRLAGGAVLGYDDPRLLRERGWKPAVAAACGASAPAVVTGVPPKAAAALGGRIDLGDLGAFGASAPLFALAALGASPPAGDVVVVGLDGGAAVAASVSGQGAVEVRRDERTAAPAGPPVVDASRLPSSAAAYERAFAPKVGLLAWRCECGAAEVPPRHLCLECGREGAGRLEPLPRTAEVYTAVTIHTPVPGRPTPYSLAVVDVDGSGVRLLVPVTDSAGTVAIGDRGRLVLRCLAERETGPDYGYAFRPEAPL